VIDPADDVALFNGSGDL